MVRCGGGTRELATGTVAEDQPSSERGRPGSRVGGRPGPEVGGWPAGRRSQPARRRRRRLDALALRFDGRPAAASTVSRKRAIFYNAQLYLSTSAPAAGRAWSQSGTRREPRQLKHRAVDEVRIVPSPPELTALLHAHPVRARHGTGWPAVPRRAWWPARGGLYGHAWGMARAAALSPDECASPLARRPYDLRHAAVSTWLNGGVPAPQVAQWAGHSVDVLLRVYAKCIAGQEDAVRRRVEEALRAGRDQDRSVHGP